MLKENLKKILIKIFYIVFAVIISITLWMYVEITENDIQTSTIPNISVILKNEDVLRNKGLLVTSIETDSLTFTVEGSRSDISSLLSAAQVGSLYAEVDLASISSAGIISLAYDTIFPQGVSRNSVEIHGQSPLRITLVVDRFLERQIQVEVIYRGGTASDELIAEAVEFDPLTISVRGPEDIVSRISYVRVPILIENLSSTYTDDLGFILMDEDNNELDDELRNQVEFSQETIRVTVPIMIVKDITLSVNLFHGASTTDNNSQWNAMPAVVKVSGDPDLIKDFNNIVIGTIDMLSFGLEDTFAFPIIIPFDHITNISGETIAMVHVEVLGMEIAHRSTSNIQTVNEPAGFRADILTQSLDVRIRGTLDDLALVTPFNIRVVADLADMNPGTSRVPARIYIDGIDAYIDPVGEYEITVTIVTEQNP